MTIRAIESNNFRTVNTRRRPVVRFAGISESVQHSRRLTDGSPCR